MREVQIDDFNIIKAMHDLANMILKAEKLNAFPIKKNTRLPTQATSVQYSAGNIRQSNQARK